LVADSALSSEENLDKLAQTAIKWITRVPATVREAQVALAQADLPAMGPLQEGYRDHELTSTDGGVEPRGVLISSEPRQPQAQRTVDVAGDYRTGRPVPRNRDGRPWSSQAPRSPLGRGPHLPNTGGNDRQWGRA
jgi:hypothetical protein